MCILMRAVLCLRTESDSTDFMTGPFLPSISVFCFYSFFITGSIACSARCRYLSYSEILSFFRPAGATRCTDWGEIKFHPIDATIRVQDPQN